MPGNERSQRVRDLTAAEPDDSYTVKELAAIKGEYALLRITWSNGRVDYEEFLAETDLAQALHDVAIATLDLTDYEITLAGMNGRGQEVIEYGLTTS